MYQYYLLLACISIGSSGNELLEIEVRGEPLPGNLEIVNPIEVTEGATPSLVGESGTSTSAQVTTTATPVQKTCAKMGGALRLKVIKVKKSRWYLECQNMCKSTKGCQNWNFSNIKGRKGGVCKMY